jgi:hypothetical protein
MDTFLREAIQEIKLVGALASMLSISGCQYLTKHESKPAAENSKIDQLRLMQTEFTSEVNSGLDIDTGWPDNADCDATLWAGLACSIGFPVDISHAEYSPGEIHRRPVQACWTEESGDLGAKSTVSKDMLQGYLQCLWRRKDLPALQRLADYGESHDWIMGKPETLVSRVLMSGNQIGVLGRAIWVLSGNADDRYYRRMGYLYAQVAEDYEKHLQTQSILLQDKIDQDYALTLDINDEMLTRLQENADSFPSDYLFAAALGKFTGDQTKTIDLLLNEETPCPSYARGKKPDIYCKLIWLQSAAIVLGEY